jgi:LysM repeat protein
VLLKLYAFAECLFMRPRPRSIGVPALILSGLSAAVLAGCSTGPSYSTTGSLGPRPEVGMVRDAPRTYPDGSYRQSYASPPDRSYPEQTYPQRQYTDPGTPTPRDQAYASPTGYGSGSIQTGSLGAPPPSDRYRYDPNARWRQNSSDRWQANPPPQRAPLTTGSIGAAPRVIAVREGDTLYSLSRQYNVPVGDLMAANRLPTERIAIGQQLVIPTRYR